MKTIYTIDRGAAHILIATVNERLREGWKLQGGVTVDDHGMCCQALYKDDRSSE